MAVWCQTVAIPDIHHVRMAKSGPRPTVFQATKCEPSQKTHLERSVYMLLLSIINAVINN